MLPLKRDDEGAEMGRAMWTAISATIGMCFAVVASGCEAQPLTDVPKTGPIPETKGAFEYVSVAAAATALRAKKGVQFRSERGWVVAEDAPQRTLWSFSPPEHPAHPSVVRRKVVEENGRVILSTKVFCEATKKACDALVREFDALNDRVLGGGRKTP